MRLILTLTGTEESPFTLPIHYNQLIQGFLYHHLEEKLATQLHDEGFPDAKRRLKFFTFSRLMGPFQINRQMGQICFSNRAKLVISSPIREFLESLAFHFVTASQFRLGDEVVKLADIAVEGDLGFRPSFRVKAISPITTYSTLYTADGKRKTYYYTPFESEFEQQLLSNLARKAKVWYGEAPPLEGASIRPLRVSRRNEHIVRFRGTIIKGWSGIYELTLPPVYARLAYDAGLGAKNPQGFGCVEIWNERRHRHD